MNNGFKGDYEVSNSIPEGTRLDMIGLDDCKYMASYGDSYGQRALAPGAAGEYREYVGTGQTLPDHWELRHGEVAPAFGQPGGGHQWVVIEKNTGDEVPVIELLEAGVIDRVTKP